MRPSIAFLVISKFYDLVLHVVNTHYKNDSIHLYKCIFDEAIKVAKAIEQENRIDCIITAGSTYKLLSQEVTTPILSITVSGFDLLNAIKEASTVDSNIAVVLHEKRIIDLDKIADMLPVNLEQRIYKNHNDLYRQVDDLFRNNFRTFVGTATVCDYAEKKGASAFLIYREDAVHQAIATAKQNYMDRYRELQRSRMFQTILDFCSDGIIATNKRGTITVFNSSARSITKIDEKSAIDKYIDKVLPDSSIYDVLSTGKPQRNVVVSLGDIKILTNRIPIVVNDEVTGIVATVQDAASVQQAENSLRKKLYAKHHIAKTCFDDLIGTSRQMTACITKAKHYASTDFTVMITGETGTGKELFAQSIHNASSRKSYPFIAINCAALPENLLESELFGYEEGAFTGAKKGGKPGIFELAHGGTILLDEISELPLNLQARLLRILQERELMRLGGHGVIPVDVRILAASNRQLDILLRSGHFRMDLFFRLNVLNLQIPPLRERAEDIYVLFEHFVEQYNPSLAETIDNYRNDISAIFSSYTWPGNIRELQNICTRFIAIAQQEDNVMKIVNELRTNLMNFTDSLEGIRPHIILNSIKKRQTLTDDLLSRVSMILRETDGNKAEAARRLNISRTTLWRWLRTSKMDGKLQNDHVINDHSS